MASVNILSVDYAKLAQWLERALEKLKPGDSLVAQTLHGELLSTIV